MRGKTFTSVPSILKAGSATKWSDRITRRECQRTKGSPPTARQGQSDCSPTTFSHLEMFVSFSHTFQVIPNISSYYVNEASANSDNRAAMEHDEGRGQRSVGGNDAYGMDTLN